MSIKDFILLNWLIFVAICVNATSHYVTKSNEELKDLNKKIEKLVEYAKEDSRRKEVERKEKTEG